MRDNDIALNHLFKKIAETDNSYMLELIITKTCNLKCSYCYLQKHPELYPDEINNFEKILQNLDILFEKLLNENLTKFEMISIFSGEIWGTDFGKKILVKIIDFCKKTNIDVIDIPSNMTFLLEPENEFFYENLILEAKEQGVRVLFSQSFDGILEEENRVSKSGKIIRNEEYLNKLKS